MTSWSTVGLWELFVLVTKHPAYGCTEIHGRCDCSVSFTLCLVVFVVFPTQPPMHHPNQPNGTVTLNKIRDSSGFEQRWEHLAECEYTTTCSKTLDFDISALNCLKKNVGLQLTTFLSLWLWWLLFDLRSNCLVFEIPAKGREHQSQSRWLWLWRFFFFPLSQQSKTQRYQIYNYVKTQQRKQEILPLETLEHFSF